MAPIDLKTQLQNDPSLYTAIQHFQRAAGASTQPDLQIDALRNDPKAAPYAAKIMQLFGPDNLEKFKQKRIDTDAANKTGAEAQARVAAENSPSAIAGAANKAAAEANAKANATATSAKNEDGSWNANSIPVSLVDGNMDPSQLSKRSADYNAKLQQANEYSQQKYGRPFDIAKAQSDYKFATNPQTQNTLKYLNSLTGSDNRSGNLAALVSQSNKITRTTFPALNDTAAWARLQTGDPAMASYYAAVTEVSDQVAKILQGSGGGTSDAKLKQASELFDKGFTKDQITGVASTLRTLLANRKSELVGDNRYLQKQYGAQAQSAQPRVVPAGAIAGRDASGNIIGYKTVDGKVVRF
jgi:hypothetical protein